MATAARLLLVLGQLTIPRAVATRSTASPSIDGRLDDAAWTAAPVHDAFVQKFPDEGKAPAEQTSFRVVFDDSSVYVGIDCVQQSAPIVARLTRRDRLNEADRVTVTFDSRGDGRSAYEFAVNAAGVESDAIRYNDTELDPDWDETWEGRVAPTPRGWSAELRIPLRILRFREGSAQSWGMQVRRYVSARQETDEWAFIPRAGAGEVSRYGRIVGVGASSSSRDVELRPFVLGRFERRDAIGDGFRHGTALKVSGGVDAKWHAKRDLTLDLTVLPDFAQVEADQLVLNLSNEEIQLPEKRPFFFEGRDVFATPMSLYYTRRIGRIAPDAPELRDGEALVEPTAAASLLGATKLSGRLTDQLSVGALGALTATNPARVRTDRGLVDRPLEPGTLFQALRLKYELGGNAHIGAFASSVVHRERAEENPIDGAATLCPSGLRPAPGARCTHDAYVGAVDARWRSSDGDWTATSQVTGSALHDGPTRTLRDGTEIGSGDLGIGTLTRVAKEGGVHWVGDAVYEGASRRLDFNDLGYMKRQDIHSVSANLEYRTLSPWLTTLETHSRLELYGRANLDGLLLAHGYQLNTKWTFDNFWQVFVEAHFRGRHFDDREVGDGTALERRELVGIELEARSDPRKVVFGEVELLMQKVFGGELFDAVATGTFRVLPQLEVALQPRLVHAGGEPRFAGRFGDALVFGALRADEVSTTVRASYTFTPRLSLQTYAQVFLAAGHYSDFGSFPVNRAGRGSVVHRDALTPTTAPGTNPDFVNAALNMNILLRWEYILGSTMYFVYTRSQSPTVDLTAGERGVIDARGLSRGPAIDTILVKLTHFFG